MAAKYIVISREEMEKFLSSVSPTRIQRKGTTEGVYLLPLSKYVALRVSSSVGSKGSVVDKGKGAIHLALESLVTGKPLATKKMKDYIGQSRINRTTSWKKRLKTSIQAALRAYQDKKDFFDRIAQGKSSSPDLTKETQGEIQKDLDFIKRIPDWEKKEFLKSLVSRLENQIPLSSRQKEVLKNFDSKNFQKYQVDPKELFLLRDLYKRARTLDSLEQITIGGRPPKEVMRFITSLGNQIKNKPLSKRQQEFLLQTQRNIEKAENHLNRKKQASLLVKTIRLWSNRSSYV